MAASLNPMNLLSLARDNKPDDIEAAVKAGMPVDICNQMGQTALHIAALWGHLESIEKLVELGTDPNITNIRGATPLHFAASAKSNSKQACEMLLRLGAKTEVLDGMGRAPYELAEDDEVRALLGGPDPRIFEYCEKGNAAGLKGLLDSGEVKSVRVLDSAGRTPLNMAIAAESLDTIKVILEHDSFTLDCPDAAGDTPLHCAAAVGNLDILRHLLSLKPESVNTQNLDRSEYSSGNWMLKGETIEPLDKTPLAVAVAAGDEESAKLLLEAGAHVDIPDFDGRTPLHTALEEGDEEMLTLLLEWNANVNAPSQDFVSCLHYAATKGPISILKLLLSKGGKVNAVNEEGWTPLHLAARAGKADRAALLLDAGAKVDAANSQGNTPLHLAAINGHVAVVQLLKARGAPLDVANKEGRNPVDVAKTQEVRDALAA